MLKLTIACDVCEAESGFAVDGEACGVIGARTADDVRAVIRGARWTRRFHRAVGRMVDLCPECDERERRRR